MKIFTSCLLASTILTLTACSTEQTNSSYLQTEGIWADIKVSSNGRQSRVVAELNVGGQNGTNINLTNNDRLVTSVAGVSKEMSRDTDFLDIDYQAYFDITADHSLFNVALLRNSASNAADSEVELPLNFEIHSPQVGSHFNIEQSIDLSWDSASDQQQIQLLLASTCIHSNGNSVATSETFDITDNGVHMIKLNELSMFGQDNLDKSKNCDFELRLTRKKSGVIDSTFQSGSRITAEQFRIIDNLTINI